MYTYLLEPCWCVGQPDRDIEDFPDSGGRDGLSASFVPARGAGWEPPAEVQGGGSGSHLMEFLSDEKQEDPTNERQENEETGPRLLRDRLDLLIPYS